MWLQVCDRFVELYHKLGARYRLLIVEKHKYARLESLNCNAVKFICLHSNLSCPVVQTPSEPFLRVLINVELHELAHALRYLVGHSNWGVVKTDVHSGP